MAATISPAQPPIDPTEHFPLALVGSDAVPPAPTRSTSTIDWLPDFSGHAWVAYGASSLLVISHLPSPLSHDESLIGPILRQIFELSGSASAPVTAVCWSPATPSIGELAAASENCVSLFVHDSAFSNGSIRWSRDCVLVHSGEVEAVRWSGSGDGIVTGGLDVVLWRRKIDKTWEIAWKFRRDDPQNLVSATWSIEGPSASAAHCHRSGDVGVSEKSNVSNNVMVYYGSGNNECGKTELRHPQPVSMIQWRPTTWPGSRNRLSDLPRDVLLTCCLDGTVRLWCEVDNGKVRKLGRESSDQKGMKRNFCVGAVIEINQVLNGSLGVDVFMSWAADISGVYRIGERATRFFSAEAHGHNTVGQCEWLVGVGPGTFVSFWAVHCLDDVSPVRFPRVSLWKRQELDSFRGGVPVSDLKGTLLLNKVIASRNSLSGPPEICSLIHLLPCNSLVWSLIYEKSPSNLEDASRNESKNEVPSLTYIGGFPLEGHRGKILQVVMHPCVYQAEFAASLDSNGLVLLWSVSAVLKHNLGIETLGPAWNVCGKIVNHDSCSKFTSLRWAPSMFGEDLVILLGHIRGVDCFKIHASRVGEGDLPYSYMCTFPLGCNDSFDEGPNSIFVVNLHSNFFSTSKYNKFLVLGIWMKEFRALSWEVTFLFNNLSEHDSECERDKKTSSLCFAWKFENIGENQKNCIGVNASSSKIPEPYSHDQVTCYSVVCPSCLTPTQEGSANPENAIPAYIMATGYSDGTVKLWRSNSSKIPSPCIPWELVGKVLVSEEPISALYLTDCGQKIATISQGSQVDGISTIQIWGTVHLAGAGNFLLEDTLPVDRKVVAFSWLALGNGRFVLGVCVENELRVYVQKCLAGRLHLDHEKSFNLPTWSCIAVAPTYHAIHDFLWGTGTTAILIHDFHFSLHSQWLCLLDKMEHGGDCPSLSTEIYREEKDAKFPAPAFVGTSDEVDDLQEHAGQNINGENCDSLEITGAKKGCISNSLHVAREQISHRSTTSVGFWRIADIAWKLTDMLPVFHPEVLLVNISAGNWKRANVAVRHLTEFLSSSVGSEKGHNSATHVHFVPQIHLGNYMEGLILKNSIDRGFQWSTDAKLPASSLFMPFNEKYDAAVPGFGLSSTESGHGSSLESFENSYDLAACAVEKLQMLAVIDLLNEVQHSSSAYKNLDESGRRFWVALRFQQLHYTRRFGRSPSTEELVVDPRLYCWAFHSDCQDALLSSFLPNEPSWPEIRALGVGFWFINAAQLRSRIERLARSQYLRKKDPKDCALLYIALNRIQVLAGLFKISKDEKDKPLVGFLSRNFQEEKNKAAALKNAYVLMGRHQLELAIAFFLLGGDTRSAISVCSKNLKDDQLALVICRLVESYGGPMERHLISKSILPSSSERGDYWLGSLLEWQLGNYSRSFALMLGLEVGEVGKTFISAQSVAFSDPDIGLYCLLLSMKNNIKNAIGEQNGAVLGRWATFMITTSFCRCGLPLEALEFFSSSSSMVGAKDQGMAVDNDHLGVLHLLLNPSSNDRFNWISGDTASYLEVQAKLDLTLQYFSKLTKEHPGWPDITVGSLQPVTCSKKFQNHDELKSTFYDKLYTGLSKVEQKLSVDSSSVITMILAWLCSNGFLVVGYDVLFDYNSRSNQLNKSNKAAGTYHLHKPLMKTVGDISQSLSRFILSSSIASFPRTSCSIEVRPFEPDAVYSQSILLALCTLRVAVRIFCDLQEDAIRKPLVVVDLVECVAYSALFWLRRDSEGLLLMLAPLLTKSADGNSLYEVDMGHMAKLKESLHSAEERLTCGSSVGVTRIGQGVGTSTPCTPEIDTALSFSEDERWHVIGVCFWQHMFSLVDHKLNELSFEQEDSSSVSVFQEVVPFWRYSLFNLVFHGNNSTEINFIALILAKLLKSALACLSSYHVEFLVGFLHRKSVDKLHVTTLGWLKGSSLSQIKDASPDVDHVMSDKIEFSTFDALWVRVADSNMISKAFEQEKIEWSHVIDYLLFRAWTDFHQETSREQYPAETINRELHVSDGSAENVVSSSPRGLFKSGRSILSSWQKDATIVKGLSDFQNAKEMYKRDGELFEVMCINSINECQAAVSSNHKGIMFFNWEAEVSFGHPSSYIWSDADWPPNGWAGSESTPVPTCVSPGMGLGSKRGTHLGLGGATIGMGSLSRPRRDLTAGRAFGLPGYAGIGASGLGWEVQDDFEELVDTPATMENIHSRAFSSHPSLPFFLVGSSNTHIYLWEFGKDKATATYGILPAANVPPPYALASVSAVKFDQCGHRFATAALDGTVCTWQLEVGGRSNIRPTESYLCFNGLASDVTYVTSSGSIVATAGYNSNGVNVVIWDTLAPPTTSRASILCHEGGARSIAVFDNVIGSGSVSPLIITGGKGGDVGIHDFRYIATGRTKRHRQHDHGDANGSPSSATATTMVNNKVGDQSSSGMLWYIPKAHLGSITKISAIPHTSLFLTGSKDGDVKLWDAKAAKLVHHWPKLHERRTFLQPSSRGFGGVTRAAVTDIQVVSNGFLSCGGDGTVKLVQLRRYPHDT